MELTIGTELVGKPWHTIHREITYREMTNYCACMSDMNPRYVDDERDEPIVAHPMYALGMTVPMIHEVYDQLPSEIFDTRVHYTDQLVYFKQIHPGDKVNVTAVIVSIKPSRSGTSLTFKISVNDEAGQPYLHEYHGIVLRGVTCTEPEGKSIIDIPDIPKCPVEAPTPLWEVILPVNREFSYLYDACTGINFGIHTSPKFAKSQGLPDILVSGAPFIGFGLREVINRQVDGDSSLVETVYGKMSKMVFPDTFVKVQLLHRQAAQSHTDIFFQVQNGQKETIIRDGYVRLKNL